MTFWQDFVDYFREGLQWLAGNYTFAGDHKWALAIITLTLVVKTLLLPLAIKQIRSMREQQRLAPEIQRLRQKHRNDRQKLTQETMELYRREGVNPYAMCLPIIAQGPIFLAVFYTIRDLSQMPGISMPFLGLGQLTDPANSSVAGWLLIGIMTASQFISTRQLNPGATDQQRRIQQVIPIVFAFIMLGFPTALVLYWTTQNLYHFTQQMIMLRGFKRPGAKAKGAKTTKTKEAKATQTKAEPKREQQAQKGSGAPAPVPAAPLGAVSSGGIGEALSARRELAEKRRRRRKRKKRRRR